MLPAICSRICCIGRLRRGCQQGGRLHDLPGLAVAALRHAVVAPRDLHRMIAGRMQPLDGGDVLAVDIGQRGDAGPDRVPADMHGAGAAERRAAAEFGAGQADLVAQEPKQRQRRIAVIALARAVHVDGNHPGLPFWFVTGLRCGLF